MVAQWLPKGLPLQGSSNGPPEDIQENPKDSLPLGWQRHDHPGVIAGNHAQLTLSFIFSTVVAPPSSTQMNSNSPGPGTFMKNAR
jgi:hypothetical protein